MGLERLFGKKKEPIITGARRKAAQEQMFKDERQRVIEEKEREEEIEQGLQELRELVANAVPAGQVADWSHKLDLLWGEHERQQKVAPDTPEARSSQLAPETMVEQLALIREVAEDLLHYTDQLSRAANEYDPEKRRERIDGLIGIHDSDSAERLAMAQQQAVALRDALNRQG